MDRTFELGGWALKIVDALMTFGLAVGMGSLTPVPSVGQETTSEYRYTIVDYPGSSSACLSINARLDVICDALFNQEFPFVYDARSRRITLPAAAPPAGWSAAAFDINDSGTVVGYVYPPDDSIENGFVVTKSGEYREFSVPWVAYTEARGINNRGVITGTAFFNGPGFVTDVKELHSSKPPATGFVALAISVRHQLQIPGAFGTLPQGISSEGVVSGTFVDGSGDARGFVARPKEDD
jgi:hypothetical protein